MCCSVKANAMAALSRCNHIITVVNWTANNLFDPAIGTAANGYATDGTGTTVVTVLVLTSVAIAARTVGLLSIFRCHRFCC